MNSSKRRYFPHDGAEIYLNPDGSLSIQAETDYGDSDSGWGTATTYVDMSPEQVMAFRKFLAANKKARPSRS